MNYMTNNESYLNYLQSNEDNKYMVKIDLKMPKLAGLKSVSYRAFTEEEFEEKMKTDSNFKKLWNTKQ